MTQKAKKVKTSNEHSIDHPICLDESKLKRLVEFLKEKYQLVEVEANCEGGTKFEFTEEQLLDYSNPDHRRIQRLVIRSGHLIDEEIRNRSAILADNQCTLTFGRKDLGLHVRVRGMYGLGSVSIDGTDDRSVAIFDELKKIVTAYKPTYSAIYWWLLSEPVKFLISVLPTLLLTGILWVVIYATHVFDKLDFKVTLVFVCVTTLFLSTWWTNKVRALAIQKFDELPAALIATGDQARRIAMAEAFANTIKDYTSKALWALFIGIVGSVIATFITNSVPSAVHPSPSPGIVESTPKSGAIQRTPR